jgi:biotin transport system ATP-binding protein
MSAVRLQGITKIFHVSDYAEDRQIRGGAFYALDDITLSITRGSCTVIAGANGSGKSLLMAIIAKLEEPSSGTVELVGKVGLVFQNADSQILGETPREDIAIGVRDKNTTKDERAKIVEAALAETGLSAKADFPSRFLSGGEKRRLAVAGVLAMNADIIIFDEPYANLDYRGVTQVNTLLLELQAKQKTIIILTHELEKCLKLAESLIVLERGKIVFNGTAREGLLENLSRWGIHNPLGSANSFEDLLWL